jgi:ATP-binding protein involved in chromosome partitioning
MSGIVCAHCGELTPVFGEGGGAELAQKLEVPLLAKLPLVPDLRAHSDEGTPFVWSEPDHPVTQSYVDVARKLTEYRPRRRLPVADVR